MEAHPWPFSVMTGLVGTGEMALKLRALATLEENLDSIPRIHMVAHNCLSVTPVLGI